MVNSSDSQVHSERIDIGGRRLFFTCAGQGSPTVILDAGLGDTSDIWSLIQPAVAEFACVCSYDRAGLGQSDHAPTPRTCQDMVADVHAWLNAAHIAPPYVLVSHSFAGFIARLYASLYPMEVSGLVLVDATHEDQFSLFETVLSEDLIRQHRAYLRDPSRNVEHFDNLQSVVQLRMARRMFDFPLIVLTRGRPGESSPVWPVEAMHQVHTGLQPELLKHSTRSIQRIATDSGHYIQQDEPELVIDAIRQVVDMARQGGDRE